MRLNKALAAAGVASRRGADELIAAGRVTVDGLPAVPGQPVGPSQHISVDGAAIVSPFEEAAKARLHVLCHKPRGVVSTVRDPQGRRTVLDLLPPSMRVERLYPVGRLDADSEGLVLLTNDGELTHRLLHPSHGHAKIYHVRVHGAVTEAMLALMRRGMTLAEGDHLAPVAVSVRAVEATETELEMVLRQGVNRQIRRMCRDVGLSVSRLVRVGMADLTLADLPPGACRPLTFEESRALRRLAALPDA